MGIIESITLLGIMIALAVMPSTSVALVVTRSVTLSVHNGIAVAAGVVVGDLIFVLLVILGLSVLAETLASLFLIVRYLGATYLIWFGFSLLTRKHTTGFMIDNPAGKGRFTTSFLAGLALTLGDLKAIFFYLSLFPVFIDLAALQLTNVFIIMAVTVVAVGGVKVVYACSAAKIAALSKGLPFEPAIRKTAGGAMIGAGSYMIVQS
ncbi:LysE family translocator [Porticoccus hydrocarbonoclasticus]|jgi:threonine/homoserine/homoserine lactone efflux protein|uniref:LysE family translocator n=1 Tax=Porticoccus hydrocarbonoclasticus TaxID=1073414 RepID=UPI0023523AB3|nr:LysE family translocator [Porticoccus hydrocarbonoclasticus]|tara:strand:+ start:18361 stop:18981 length:621 start_codon:yes stop_codon:yes gene_type:complete